MLYQVSARHPVTIGELMFEGGGAFNQLIWQVQPTLKANSISDDLASIHEWSHHELNNVSSYGLLLMYFAFLARHSDDDREAFSENLKQFVANCHVAHEVYATWYSVELLTSKYSIENLLANLPADYRAFHDLGERIVRGISSPFLRLQVFLVVCRSCFEAIEFSQFTSEQPDQFCWADVCAKDLPNERLRCVSNADFEDLFQTWTNEFCELCTEIGDGEAIAVAHSRARDQPYFDLPAVEADAVLRRFLIWLTERWNEWLAKRGLSNAPCEDHLKLVPLLVDDMNRRCRNMSVTHPLSATTSPHDTASVLLQQMESEVVRIRREPIPVTIVPIRILPRELWSKLPVGELPHLFIQARPVDDLRRQHDIAPSELMNDKSGSAPVVFLRRRSPPDEYGHATVNVFCFETFNELKELRAATPSVRAYGLMSSSLAVDQTWMDQWLDSSIIWASMIDHSLHTFLTQHCKKQAHVRYSTSTLRDGDRVLQFICFLTRDDGDSQWGLHIGFCSEHTAKACVQFIQQKLNPDVFVLDREPFEGLVRARRGREKQLLRLDHGHHHLP